MRFARNAKAFRYYANEGWRFDVAFNVGRFSCAWHNCLPTRYSHRRDHLKL